MYFLIIAILIFSSLGETQNSDVERNLTTSKAPVLPAPLWEKTQASFPWERTRVPYLWERTRAPYPWEKTRAPYPWELTREPYPWERTRGPYPWEVNNRYTLSPFEDYDTHKHSNVSLKLIIFIPPFVILSLFLACKYCIFKEANAITSNTVNAVSTVPRHHTFTLGNNRGNTEHRTISNDNSRDSSQQHTPSASEKPPDYASVILSDLSEPTPRFPSVIIEDDDENPPPYCDDNMDDKNLSKY